jgi:predicted dehydrogenase
MTAWGILSTARINTKLLAGAAQATDVDVVACASRDKARCEAFASEHGIPRGFASYEELLADPEVEAVYIPLPNSLHVPWSIKALEAGKHVLCEKPLSRHPADVEAAFDAAERAGRLLMEAFMWRYHPQTETIAHLVREGAIGRLRLVRAAFGFPLDPEEVANVRWSGELEGGALMDVGCYCVSGLRLLGGEPVRVSAQAVRGGQGVDARLAGALSFEDDVLGLLDCALDVAPRSALEVVGDEGALVAEDPWHGLAPRLTLRRDGAEPEELTVVAVNPYARELEDFSAAIREGRQPRLGREDALGQARTIEALYRSADEGRAVELG